jgi:hypothetical protein
MGAQHVAAGSVKPGEQDQVAHAEITISFNFRLMVYQ